MGTPPEGEGCRLGLMGGPTGTGGSRHISVSSAIDAQNDKPLALALAKGHVERKRDRLGCGGRWL